MPINAMIPMAHAPRRRVNPLAETMGAVRIGNELRERDALDASAAQAETFRNALAGAVNPDGTPDHAAISAVYRQSGDPAGALAYEGEALAYEGEARRLQAEKAAEIIHRAGSVNSQEELDALRARSEQLLPGANSGLPEIYTPQAMAAAHQSGISALDKMKMANQRANQPLVAVHAPESPTGSRMVPRSQAAGQPGPKRSALVDMGQQESAENKAEGGRLVSEATAVFEAGDNARAEIAQLEIAKGIPVDFGATEPARAAVNAFAEGLGFDPERLGIGSASGAQMFTGIMQNLVLRKMQAQKGPQTENDAKRIERTIARLGNTPEAAKFLMEAGIALRERDVARAEFYADHKAETGSYKGARRKWSQTIGGQSIFSDPEGGATYSRSGDGSLSAQDRTELETLRQEMYQP